MLKIPLKSLIIIPFLPDFVLIYSTKISHHLLLYRVLEILRFQNRVHAISKR